MKSILSTVIFIDKTSCIESIEEKLKENLGSIVRWAVIGVENSKLKICVTYESGA
ncbi:hypothetical protein IJ541_03385 [bacterium]|nr:hypothetical protein [bacterium]